MLTLALAATLVLTCDPPAETNVIAHRIYVGTASGVYSTNHLFTNTLTFAVTNLASSGRYYFVAKAINVYGLESDMSSEVVGFTKPSVPNLVTNVIQSASSLNGPWSTLATVVVPIETNAPQQFVRSALHLGYQTPPPPVPMVRK